MLIQLNQEQLSQALQAIKRMSKEFESHKIEGYITAEMKTNVGLAFYVDQWPNFTTMLYATTQNYKFPFLDGFFGFNSTDSNVMKKMLRESEKIMRQRKEMNLMHWPIEYEDFYKQLFASWNTKIGHWSRSHIYTIDTDHLKPCTLHEDYTECELTEEHADLLNNNWDHNKAENSVDFIRFQLRHFPNVGVTDKAGNLVAWELQYFIGCTGLLFVMPEHRGKGLAQYVIYRLSKKLLEQGKKVFCYIEDFNEASKRLHEKCGFTTDPSSDSLFAIVKPFYNS